MKLLRVLLTLGAVAILVGVACVGREAETAGMKMTAAADKFLQALTDEQKAKALLAFDDKERFNWHFTPYQDSSKKPRHKGLAVEQMTREQKEAALGLLRAGTSAGGYEKATTIMSLESILADLEKGRGPARNPGWYFFTVFGQPSKTGKWGWRVEGHHLSLNFTLDKGKVVAATPAFFGANPATIMAGPMKGKKTLGEAEDLARELFSSLDEGQKKAALQPRQFAEIQEATRLPSLSEPVGLAAGKMNEKQRELLDKLIDAYAGRMPPEIAERELSRARAAGRDKVHFAWAGGGEPGQPRSYRVHGPTFVIEFLNVQADSAGNPANHIHSAWRSLKNDFGLEAN